MTYSGYLNYYIGSTLKTYHFNEVTEAMYYLLVKVAKMRASVFVDALVYSVLPHPESRKHEIRQLVDSDFLLPRRDSKATTCLKKES